MSRMLLDQPRRGFFRSWFVIAGLAAGGTRAIAGLPAIDQPPLPVIDTRAAFGVVTLDLAADPTRHVVVDREPAQYLGHPTTTLLPDGRTIIAVYPRGHGSGGIVMKRSPDGGRTWSDRLPVDDSWATSKETPTIFQTVDPQGTRRLLLFSGLYPIRLSHSSDEGRTWTPLTAIGRFGGIVAMSSVERLADGSHMALFHDDGRFIEERGTRGVFKVYKTLSRDGGLTWSTPVVIASLADVDLCEPGLVRSADGRHLTVILRENRRVKRSHVIESFDEGGTWTPPREVSAALTGDRHVARYLPDGRLFITFRDMAAGSPTKGDWVAWVGRHEDIGSARAGDVRVRLMDNHHDWDAAYAGLERLPDGALVATSYGHWTAGQPPYIVAVHVKAGDVSRASALLRKQ